MPKTNKLQKHTLFLRRGDMEYIKSAMPHGKASHFVRRVISATVDNLRTRERERERLPKEE